MHTVSSSYGVRTPLSIKEPCLQNICTIWLTYSNTSLSDASSRHSINIFINIFIVFFFCTITGWLSSPSIGSYAYDLDCIWLKKFLQPPENHLRIPFVDFVNISGQNLLNTALLLLIMLLLNFLRINIYAAAKNTFFNIFLSLIRLFYLYCLFIFFLCFKFFLLFLFGF